MAIKGPHVSSIVTLYYSHISPNSVPLLKWNITIVFITLITCSNQHFFSFILSHKLTKWNSLTVIVHVCTTCLHTQPFHISYSLSIIEWMQWILYHLLALQLNAERYSGMLFSLLLCLSWFVSVFSPSLLLTSCLWLALFLWNPVAVLAEKMIWLADRPGEGMPGPHKYLGDFSDWDFWLSGWLWAWLTTKWRRLLCGWQAAWHWSGLLYGWMIERLPLWLTSWLVV